MPQAAHPSETPDSTELTTLLRDSAADFCSRALPRTRLRVLRNATPAFDRTLWRQMAELGWTGILAPIAQGGLGLGLTAAVEVARKLGSVAAPEPLIETAIAALTVLEASPGSAALRQAVTAGDVVITAALGGGADGAAFTEVRAEAHGSGYRLDGVRRVPLGPDAAGWLVPATLAGTPAWLHVEAARAGVQAQVAPLADGTRDAVVKFENVEADLLCRGAEAQAALACARIRAEVTSSAYLLGLADTLLQLTLDYVVTRKQFGQAIGSFQVLQHRLVDLVLQLRLTEAVVGEACAIIARDLTGPTARQAASRARHRACDATLLIAREAVQLHGAMGYTDECDVGLLLNRALVVSARYGNAREHAAHLARAGLESFETSPANAPAVDAEMPMPAGGWNVLDNETFRRVVRQWHDTHYPAALRNPPARLRWHQCKDWYATLHARGWAAPGWPTAHGGMGLSPDKLLIFIEERERLGVARTPDQGIIMVGPVLMQHGSPAQQAYWLPRALSGEHLWCQGYSEPNAGSDLASLRTSAVRDGDDFVINGQKIWTTMAQDATHMFCLVRTDPAAKPQAGISFVLIDIKTPGITIRPIRNIAGDAEFCEVFLDNVRTPVANLVGKLHDGWTIAKALLGFERLFIGSPKQCQYALSRLRALGQARGLFADPVFAARYTQFALDTADLESLYKVFADVVRRGETLGPDVSLLKIWASETFSRLSEFIVEAAGDAGAQLGEIDFDGTPLEFMSLYYNARTTTIYGGSNEIQRNIIAKQVLRLPSR